MAIASNKFKDLLEVTDEGGREAICAVSKEKIGNVCAGPGGGGAKGGIENGFTRWRVGCDVAIEGG